MRMGGSEAGVISKGCGLFAAVGCIVGQLLINLLVFGW
jgi:hypothetical protein